ncbi:MAG: hypothetical protein PHC54_02585 [Candidatus Omnitrophica bacterium]|nr:hypothetical protein [Candidatus Omnitrophota bacterium]MDD5592240.1 hypothetical protein [Candidatus Omnitrophota bacterium]
MAAGILIDSDHVLDYYANQGITLKIKDIYAWCVEEKYRLIVLIFHSLELAILLWILIWFLRLGIFWIALAIGITQHMVFDLLFNRKLKIFAYFFTFRIIKGFKGEKIFR